MTLNIEQQQVFDFFLGIQKVKTPCLFILNAPAGTGKTYLIKELYQARKGIQILTPTNKAASLFPRRMRVQTIHRFFGSHLCYSDDGDKSFKLTHPAKMPRGLVLLVVDEASMVSSDMLAIFLQLKVNILFTCDEAQLPPVNEPVSPIFNLSHKRFNLSVNMRSGSLIVQQIREKKTTADLLPEAEVDDIINCFKEPEPDCVVLAWTNVRKNQWNHLIRTRLFQDEKLEDLYEGETLVFTGCRQEPSHHYYTSDNIKVESLDTLTDFVPYYPRPCECPRSCDDREDKGCPNCKKELGLKVKMFVFIDQYQSTWFMPYSKTDVRHITKLLGMRKKYILSLPAQQRTGEWIKYYTFQNTFAPDLEYAYSSTVHKAQGSEWRHVFVDYDNISRSEKSQGEEFKDRIMYTAVSRMKDTVMQVEFDEFQ